MLLAGALYRAGDLDAALKEESKAIDLDRDRSRDDPICWLLKAAIHARRGEAKEARECLAKLPKEYATNKLGGTMRQLRDEAEIHLGRNDSRKK